ncbi:Putative succinate-semialdehyde dehydrogenase [NADP(+)] 2 [Paraconexibacter sp. AEG42_29]|uniref:Succinate-semialdehyde dehydrogenase [NADP(+)] 2 n=1 Tax=Paraconexibacter sp. AEG42_29 TaxID=2997339 RepID=A0AAU7APM9_9ACTN
MSTAEAATDELIVRCPGTGKEVGRVPVTSGADVAALAASLRAAQPAWEALGYAGRAAWLHRWRDWMLDNEQQLLALVQSETGKSWNDTNVELPIALEVINYYAKNAASFLADEHPKPHTPAMATKQIAVRFRPHPLIALITPWNGPIGNPMLDLPAALMAGCAALTKPSEVTPLTWAALIDGWKAIGAPPVLDCAQGGGDVGAAVVDVVDMVHFTGSVATGRRIGARCGERLIPCSLELGGKDPMLVLADADLERAANAAVWGGFMGAGQACISVERVYVDAPVFDEFVDLVATKTRALRVGMDPGPKPAFDLGAMATEDQVAIVERHVADALAKGARALTGGRRLDGPGLFYAPTVLVDVDHTMDCMREETFGPTLPIMKVDGTDEAVALANDSAYGLSGSVWTRDRAEGERIAALLEVGAVNLNNVYINLFQLGAPQGGWRDSGVGGRLGGPSGIRKYCREQVVVGDRIAPKSELPWYPASATKLALQARGSRFLGARDWRRRLGLAPRSSQG